MTKGLLGLILLFQQSIQDKYLTVIPLLVSMVAVTIKLFLNYYRIPPERSMTKDDPEYLFNLNNYRTLAKFNKNA